MNPTPNGVNWKASKGDLVVCIDPKEVLHTQTPLEAGKAYSVVRHSPETGWITVVLSGSEVVFCDTRFAPAYPPRPGSTILEPKKNDQDKPRMDIVLSIHGIEQVGHVFGHGAKKYDEFNWRRNGNDEQFKRRMAAAAIRHITSYLQGTKTDDESKRPHLAHAIADLLMILDLEETK